MNCKDAFVILEIDLNVINYNDISLEYLKKAEETNKWDPLKLFSTVQNAVAGMATEHMRLFGSSGRI
jgi:fructose-bisphosphate aldolase class II